MQRNRRTSSGFSLIELVIVVVIIGIIAAIAIPRMSRGAGGAADNALKGDLNILRSAIDLYNTDHNAFPSSTNATFISQMTSFSDPTGATFASSYSSSTPYGPYLRSVPAQPINGSTARKGATGVAAADASGIGWIYDGAGNISANTGTTSDSNGTLYSQY